MSERKRALIYSGAACGLTLGVAIWRIFELDLIAAAGWGVATFSNMQIFGIISAEKK